MQKNYELSEQFKHAFELLENSNKNVFVTGKAGTGKSTLLEYFRDNTSKNIVVLAPTGVSAVNIKGQTIHSFFRFKPDITVEGVYSIKVPKAKKKMYNSIDAIVIDEISMVRADLFDCINEFLQLFGKHKDLPFGGVQMIFFGDMYQLPPVVSYNEREIFTNNYKSPYFFDAKSFRFLRLQYVELTRIYRQSDKKFVNLLNSIRNKSVTNDDLLLLNKRFVKDFKPQEKDFYIYLTTTNDMADTINKEYLEVLNEEYFSFEGEVSGDFEKRNLPTQYALDLKKGAQVMLLNNDPMGRWVNGSIGKIVSLKESANGEETDVIKVELSNGRIVSVNPFTWEMFRFYYNEDTKSLDSESVGAFTQYPIRLAWAVTIHKAQGKTFDNVVLDVGYGTFAHGQLYVALSRCTSLEGITLKRPITNRHILLDDIIVSFMKQAKEALVSIN